MKLRGHSKIRTQLTSLIEKGKLPHGIILSGPSGVGKSLLAKELAVKLLCEKKTGCHQCKGCKLASAFQHPDLYLKDCNEKDSVDAASIRELLHNLSFRSFSGSSRVVIFQDAERLSALSANILLKSLEEPNQDTFFILTSSQPSLLPRTVLSRLHRWNIDLLSNEEVFSIISELHPKESKEIKERWTAICSGSLDMLSSLSEADVEYSEFEQLLISLGQKKIAPLIVFLQKRAKDKENLPICLALLRSLLRKEALRESPHQEAYAQALSNILASERLIFERNLQAPVVLGAALTLPFFGSVTSPKIIDDALFSAS